MKRLMFPLLLFSINCFSQIQKTSLPDLTKVGEVKSAIIFKADLNYFLSNKDTVYIIQFDNQKYTSISDIQSVQFKETGGVLNELYKIMSEAINAEKGKENAFKLGDEEVLIKSSRMMGIKYIYFYKVKNGAFFNLTKKEIDKLFNKS